MPLTARAVQADLPRSGLRTADDDVQGVSVCCCGLLARWESGLHRCVSVSVCVSRH